MTAHRADGPAWGREVAGRRVLVAGATGFIGRAVARRLAELGARLWLPVRDPDAAREMFEALGIPGEIRRWSALEDHDIDDVVADAKPEMVFNLVGHGVAPPPTDERLAEALNATLPGRLLRAVAKIPAPEWPGCRLVHAGSALEYGSAGGDLGETTPPRPTTLYGRTKLAGTLQVAELAETLAVRAVTARLFSVYGPGEHPGRLLPTLLAARRESGRIPLTDGGQRRDFTWVGDVAEGLVRLASTTGAIPPIVNLATGTLRSVREFVQIAAEALGIEPTRLGWGELPSRPAEMSHDPVRVDRLRGLCGWVPSTRIDDGVRQTLAFEARYGSFPSSPDA